MSSTVHDTNLFLSGLDPAQPYFQDTPIEVRLDKTDADFVDVIHTDSAPTIPYLGEYSALLYWYLITCAVWHLSVLIIHQDSSVLDGA